MSDVTVAMSFFFFFFYSLCFKQSHILANLFYKKKQSSMVLLFLKLSIEIFHHSLLPDSHIFPSIRCDHLRFELQIKCFRLSSCVTLM